MLYAIDIFSKYAWVIPLKDRKRITNTNAFQKILDEAYRKPNKIWVGKRSEFYNRSVKSPLQDKDIECIQHIMKKSLFFRKDLLET